MHTDTVESHNLKLVVRSIQSLRRMVGICGVVAELESDAKKVHAGTWLWGSLR